MNINFRTEWEFINDKKYTIESKILMAMNT